MKTYKAIGASAGIAIGLVHLYSHNKIVVESDEGFDPKEQEKRIQAAIAKAGEDLIAVMENTRKCASEAEAGVFEAHIMLLNDIVLMEKVLEALTDQHCSAEYAWYQATCYYSEMISSLNSEYISARSADIDDISQRVLRILKGDEQQNSHTLVCPSIIMADELTPSDTVSFNKKLVLGFATAKGGATSHVAILSKSLGIPAIVGIGEWKEELLEGEEVVVDGFTGQMIVDPDEKTLKAYRELSERYQGNFKNAFEKTHEPAITIDGRSVEIVSNIGGVDDAHDAVEFGAEGVGLLRTEFIFLERNTSPTEEEQFTIYQQIFSVFGSRPVVARTLDIGGDKPAEYLKIPQEMNPFLGLRGTRLALARTEVFRTQLRALLRASVGYNVKIMFPMIGTASEVRKVRHHFDEVKIELEKEGKDYNKQVEFGIMVEIPSAAVIADILAKEVDFFSIGTNDLSQYTMAADRGNSDVATIANALDPAVLRLIHMVVKAAHANKKWVGLCGELAGDPLGTPVLLGIGVDEFSMNPRSIPLVKQAIRQFTMEKAREIAAHALDLPTAEEVRVYLETY